jgi:hypothetical protein
VFRKAELGKFLVDFAHYPITSHLCDDTGRRDRKRLSIAFDDSIVGQGEILHWEAVNEAVARRRENRFRRPLHCQMRRSQDVQIIDFLAARGGNRPNDIRVSG